MTAIILEAALRGLALAAVVGLVLTVLRVRNVPARKSAWTLVLLASLAMPLLMRAIPSRFGWVVPVRFTPRSARAAVVPPAQPVMVPQAAAHKASAVVNASAAGAPAAAAPLSLDLAPGPGVADSAPEQSAHSASSPRRVFHSPPVAELIIWVYLAVAGTLLLRLAMGLMAALRLWVTAERVSPLVAPEPNVRSSSRIASPVTIGSGIVLPADYTHWDARKLRMVMAHERSHVRQLDFYLQLLAGLYTALFWFSPLGWWLRRTLSALGETISDRDGIAAAASRAGYASLVLEFAALPHKLLPGVAMARSTNLSRRVDSMLNENLFRTLFSEGRRRAMASLLLVPAALFAVLALVRLPSAAAQSTPPNTQPSQAQTPTTGQSNPPEDQVTSAAPAAPPQGQTAPPAPPAPAAGVAADNPGPAPAAPTMPQAPPAPATTPEPPASAGPYATSIGSGRGAGYGVSVGSGQSSSATTTVTNSMTSTDAGSEATAVMENGSSVSVHGHHSYVFSDGQTVVGNGFRFSSNGDSWAIVNGPGNDFTFTGDWGDTIQSDIGKARKMANGPFLWFTHDGKSFVVTDPAILARIQQMNAPILALGRRQAELGKQQEGLGRQQEELGRTRSDRITIRMPDLSKEMDAVNAEIAEMKVDQYQIDARALADLSAQLKASEGQMLTPEKLAEIQQRIAAIQQQLTPERIAETQAKLGELQARLGALQGEAGAREGDFGERMGELGERQGALGEQQGKLGEEQGRLSEEMDRNIRQIIEEALKNGTAKPVQ
jgi:beta-lactamase regulating signal transducer with metallopeptidase domain